MIRKRKLLIISVLLIITFICSTNYLLTKLASSQSEVITIHEKIYQYLKVLPKQVPKSVEKDIFDKFVQNIRTPVVENDITKLWQVANSWVSENQLTDLESPFIGSVLKAMKNSKIIKADLDTRGTQLKLLLTLTGQQSVVFKPKWYDVSTVIEGPVYAGKDRYNSEIVAFYLSVILNMPFTPCSVDRAVSFTQDIVPVATKRLINSSFEFNNRTCIYGKCFYCKKQDPVCEDVNFTVYGAVIFNVDVSFKSYRSPWQRTYKKNKKAAWEEDDGYCKYIKERLTKRRLLDLVDVSIFDFLMQNGDRHHYETLYDNVMLLDNGKGLGNPSVSHLDILAPLYQCCVLRSTTLKKLLNLAGGNLRKKLESIPNITNLLTAAHMTAMEERLLIVFATIEYCKNVDRKQ